MNKLLAVTSGLLAAGAVSAEFSMPAFTVDAKIEFATKHVSEGTQTMKQNFAPKLEVGLPVFEGGNLYVGVDAYLGINSDRPHKNEVDPYIGFSYDITDMFTLDVGYTYKRFGMNKGRTWYDMTGMQVKQLWLLPEGTDANGRANALEDFRNNSEDPKDNRGYTLDALKVKRFSHEVYAGIIADISNIGLRPSLYFAYDFTQKKANVEGKVNYTLDFGKFGVNGLGLDLGAKVGYSHAKKPYGVKMDKKLFVIANHPGGKEPLCSSTAEKLSDMVKNVMNGVSDGKGQYKKGWFYAGVSADLTYSLNENTKARAGVEFSYNNAKKLSNVNWGNKKTNVWFTSALEFAF